MENQFSVFVDFQSTNHLSYMDSSYSEYLAEKVVLFSGTQEKCSNFCSLYSEEEPYERV